MKTLVVLLLFASGCLIAQAQSPAFNWVKQLSDTAENFAADMVIDATGNIFITGCLKSTMDLDPSPAISLHSANPSNYNSFILKLDAGGNFVWAKTFEGRSTAISTDLAGNVLTTGYFQTIVDFDPGPASYTLDAGGPFEDVFVLKLNNAGNFVWVTAIGGANFIDQGRDIVTDANNNIYVTGRTVSNAFVAKLDPAGSVVWANGLYSVSEGLALDVDAGGNVISTGRFEYSGTDFDPGSGSYTMSVIGGGLSNTYIWKLSPAGAFIWARQIEGAAAYSQDIECDAQGNVVTCGYFMGMADFDVGTGTTLLNATGVYDGFILKLDAAGNYSWAQKIGGANAGCMLDDIRTDQNSDIYYVSHFSLAPVDFDPGAALVTLTPVASDLAISKTDGLGNFVWAKQLTCTSDIFATAVRPGINNDIYTCGGYNGTTDFDPSTATFSSTSVNNSADFFLHKMALCNSNTIINVSSSASLICAGTTATLSALGAASYTWNNFFVNPKLIVSPTQNTTYTVSGNDANGCYLAATITQSVAICTDVSEAIQATAAITIYPNPTAGRVIVEVNIPDCIFNYELSDGTLKKIFAGRSYLVGNKMQLDFFSNEINAGIYFLRLSGGGNNYSLKLSFE